MMPDAESERSRSSCAGKPLPLSVAIITLNEEENLLRCLKSVARIAGEIVVIDSGSTDRTRDIAVALGANFEVHPWQGHIAQKNIALGRCTQPWVLCLDADEELSPEAAVEIAALLGRSGSDASGFWLNRRNFYLGRWIRHAWNPEWRLRLVRRDRARWGGLNPHDKLEVDGPTLRLKGELLHYPFTSLYDHLETELKYARIMADSYVSSGRAFRWYQLVFSPWIAWLRVLVLKSAWRDGWRGWFIAGTRWLGTFAKYALFAERKFAAEFQRKPPNVRNGGDHR
ncbi:MAG TPA: glycosyltransferase family 2 protein [Candidatus Paceibacterota bacterium]|nr:glycosyltransferase family 2 protein [Candidatus Paceibacterota bacterium]